MENPIRNFIKQMPKAELHVHLEGSIQPETLLELAQRNKKIDALPAKNIKGIRKWFTFTDFPHFLEVYLTIQDMICTAKDLETITYRFGEDMARQNILYREATFTPYIHTHEQDKGLTIDDILEGLQAGRQRAKKDLDVEIRWIFDISRQSSFIHSNGIYNPEPAERTLEYAIKGKEYGVVGLGLGGYEVGTPATAFEHAFKEARLNGLLCVPHAGETEGPDNIWGSIRALDADRIGHGVRAIEDPQLLEYLKEQQIPLEVNLSSNICLHVFPDLQAHPFKKLDELGLMLTLASDDPPLFNTDLNQEYQILADVYGYQAADLLLIARNGFLAAGVEPEVKQRLLSTFDSFAETGAAK